MKLTQKLKSKQKQVMTPALIQRIRMLRLSAVEIYDMIKHELLTNPVLEEGHIRELQDRIRITADDSISRSTSEIIENTVYEGESLYDHLIRQARIVSENDDEYYIFDCIVSSLDEKGFLDVDPDKLAIDIKVDLKLLKDKIEIVKNFDPPGCGASNINESLLTQAENYYPHDTMLHEILKNHLDELGKENYSSLAETLKTSVPVIMEKKKMIRKLNPYPGRLLSSEKSEYIVPDIIVGIENDTISISINESWFPELRINPAYLEMGNRKEPGNHEKEYIFKSIESAKLLIKNIYERRETILKVSSEIINYQSDFVLKGPGNLRHLSQKDIADKTGFHESTISRIISNKYVQTPKGTYALKNFFSSRIINKAKNKAISSDHIKREIQKLVLNEDRKRPLNDSELVSELKKYEISIARRTVSKYRHQLKIPSAGKRKEVD